MAYTVHYRITYKRSSNGTTTIDILENGYSGAITELTADINPLEITQEGNVNNIYKPTQGSSAVLRIVAPALTLLGLFTNDPQKFIVKCFHGTTGQNLFWQGFISTGIYGEDYSSSGNVGIELICNDGMLVLEDIPYSTAISSGSKYNGFQTVGTVLQTIFSKLGLVFTGIRTASDLSVGTAKTNLFLYLTVNNENYYDESGVPMNCRKVLESICSSLGLVMSFNASTIYFIDPINLHTKSIGKSYGLFGTTETQTDLGGYLDITAKDIQWFETGSRLDVVQPFNSVKVKYDPYSFTDASYGFTQENAGNTTTYAGITDNGITYNYFTEVTMKGWEIGGIYGFDGIQETGSSTLDDPQYFIKQTSGVFSTNYYSYVFPQSCIKQDDGLMLLVNFDVYVNTKNVSNIIQPAEAETIINTLYMNGIEIKVGDKWWNGANWCDYAPENAIYIREIDAKVEDVYLHKTWFRKRQYLRSIDLSRIDDRWTTVMQYIPLSEAHLTSYGLLAGDISIKIPKLMQLGDITPTVTLGWETTHYVKNLLIKNISVQIVDTNKIPIQNSTIESTASIDNASQMKASELSIELKNGIGTYGVSKGAFSSSETTPQAGTNIKGLYRGSDIKAYNTPELLAQSLLGQYGQVRNKLTGTLNVGTNFLDTPKFLIKDTAYLSSKAFYICGYSYSDETESMQVEMIELTATRETITV